MVTQDTRRNLLRAASASIADHGVRGLRVEDVAARAGVVVSLVYYYFGSRAGLLQATMEYANERAPLFTLAELDQDGRPAYQLLERKMLDELAASKTVRENCVVWQELTASAVFDPELRQKVSEVGVDWTREIASFIEAGQSEGSIRSDVSPLEEAEVMTSLLDGLISRWLSGSLTRTRARHLLRTVLRDRLHANVSAVSR